jgi:phage terminase large subunit-like protein
MPSANLKAALARRDFYAFCRFVRPDFDDSPHLRYLAKALDDVAGARAAGSSRDSLAISAPPGHAKSSIAQLRAAYELGRNPGVRIMLFSSNAELAVRNSREVRAIVSGSRWPFPGVKVASDERAGDAWSTNHGGGVRAFGIRSEFMGFRAEIIVCDDLQIDPGTPAGRESLETWFRSILSSRREPGGYRLLLQSRWGTDDIAARLQDGADADQWRFINLPALAVENDPLRREVGEALWPARWPVPRLAEQRAAVGDAVFAAQYQGVPTSQSARIFSADMFDRYDRVPARPRAPYDPYRQFGPPDIFEPARDIGRNFVRLCAMDTAGKATSTGSFNAFVTLLTDGKHVFVLEVETLRGEFEQMRAAAIAHLSRWNPDVTAIENASMGGRLFASLQATTHWPVELVDPQKGKAERAEAAVRLLDHQYERVLLPRSALWVDDFLTEALQFPDGRFSDAVDAFVWGMLRLDQVRASRRRRPIGFHFDHFTIFDRVG